MLLDSCPETDIAVVFYRVGWEGKGTSYFDKRSVIRYLSLRCYERRKSG